MVQNDRENVWRKSGLVLEENLGLMCCFSMWFHVLCFYPKLKTTAVQSQMMTLITDEVRKERWATKHSNYGLMETGTMETRHLGCRLMWWCLKFKKLRCLGQREQCEMLGRHSADHSGREHTGPHELEMWARSLPSGQTVELAGWKSKIWHFTLDRTVKVLFSYLSPGGSGGNWAAQRDCRAKLGNLA